MLIKNRNPNNAAPAVKGLKNCLCLFVCLTINMITYKVIMNGFA